MSKPVTPLAQWEALRAEFLKRVEEIDKATEWSPTEPQWWLEMMYAYRVIERRRTGAD